MTQRQYRTLSKRIVDSLPVDGRDTVYWDRELPGFGLRVYASGKKVFVVQTRAFGRSRRVTLGEHGNPLSADRARKEAAEVIVRIKTGQPPIPKARPTIPPSPTSRTATSANMSRCTASRPPSPTTGSCCASTSCPPSAGVSSLRQGDPMLVAVMRSES